LEYWRVYPARELKQEYAQRMKQRGNPKNFVDKFRDKDFDVYLQQYLDDNQANKKIELKSGEYLETALGNYLDVGI
jgi:hypothetical protein